MSKLSVDEMMKIPYPSYHKPLEIARTKGRSKGEGDREFAAKFLRALNVKYPHILAIGQELVFVLMELKLNATNDADSLRYQAEAEAELERFQEVFPTLDEEFLSRWGRWFKDQGDRYMGFPWLINPPAVNLDEASWYYRKSLEKYDQAYRIRSGHYPGINMAMLYLMLGALKAGPGGSSPPDEVRQAEDLARKIVDSRAQWPAVQDDDETVWFPATLGEAFLIHRDWDDAREKYLLALRSGKLNASAKESMRRQIQRILLCFDRLGVAAEPPFDNLDRFFLAASEPPPVAPIPA